MTNIIRVTAPDQVGRRFGYRFCPSCWQEHSFGCVYPDGTTEVQFPEEFGLDRATAEMLLSQAARGQ